MKVKSLSDYNVPLLNLRFRAGKEYELTEEQFKKLERFDWLQPINSTKKKKESDK